MQSASILDIQGLKEPPWGDIWLLCSTEEQKKKIIFGVFFLSQHLLPMIVITLFP